MVVRDARAAGRSGSSAPAPPSGCTQRSSGMPTARAVSASVTSNAAPWFTNGLAVSDFGYGNETIRLPGPTFGDLVRVARLARPRVRVGRGHARELAPTARPTRPARRPSVAPSCAAQRVLVQREAVHGAGDADGTRRAAAPDPLSGWSSASQAASTAAGHRLAAPGSSPACPRRRRAARPRASPAAIRAAAASSARIGVSPPTGCSRRADPHSRRVRVARPPVRGDRRTATRRSA